MVETHRFVTLAQTERFTLMELCIRFYIRINTNGTSAFAGPASGPPEVAIVDYH